MSSDDEAVAELGADGGWTESAEAWIALAEDHDTRLLLLDPVMLLETGEVAGQRVLDLGCGEGRFCRRLAVRGAHVVGLDPTPALLREARRRASTDAYVRGGGEALPFADGAFHVVVSYLSLVDITNFRQAIKEAARVLCPGGRMVTANVTAIASAAGPPVLDEAGHFRHYAVDAYLEERATVQDWAGIRIRNWHRPLSAVIDAYLDAGLTLRRYIEPVPADESLRQLPRFESWYRVPTFDVMVWEKQP